MTSNVHVVNMLICFLTVLSQVRNFLPKLATANEELQKRLESDPEYSADIEQIDDEDAPHIEMVRPIPNFLIFVIINETSF